MGGNSGGWRLGDGFAQRYGAPYMTVHRADLQAVLVDGARRAGVDLQLASRITQVLPGPDAVRMRIGDARESESDVLVGADGLWSEVRGQVCSDGPPQPTGHLAYRTLSRADRPAGKRCAARTSPSGSARACTWWPTR